MRFIVLRDAPEAVTQKCQNITDPTDIRLIDLLVNADLPEGTIPNDLIGKIVEVEELRPFKWIGVGVKIVGEYLKREKENQ